MKRRLMTWALALCMALTLIPKVRADFDSAAVRHGVVRIYTGFVLSDDSWNEAMWDSYGRGSGFFVGNADEKVQYIITNRHVIDFYLNNGQGERIDIEDADGNTIYVRAQIRVYYDRNDYEEAYVTDYSDFADIAILRIGAPTDKRAALPLMLPDESMVGGNQAYAVGFPGVSDNEAIKAVTETSETDETITPGNISRLLVETSTGNPVIQTTAIIHAGNSGGPLVYENGAVIGVNTWSVPTGSLTTPLYYALSVEALKPMLDKNSVPYQLVTLGEEPASTGLPVWAIAAIAVAVVAVAAAAILLGRKKKTAAPAPASNSTPPTVPGPSADTGWRVQGVAGALEGKRFMVRGSGVILVGRDPQAGICFPANTAGVSGRHCEIWYDNGSVFLRDLDSSNGTFVSGTRAAAQTPVRLREGEMFWLGSEKEKFVLQKKR